MGEVLQENVRFHSIAYRIICFNVNIEVDKMVAVFSIDGCNLKKKLKHEMYFLKTTGAKILNNENRRRRVEVHKIAEKKQFLNNFHPFFSNANQEDL